MTDTSDQTFDHDALECSRELPVVVDFWAPWCQPCRLLTPTLEKLAAEYAGRVIFLKANVDQMPATASRFGVMSIPAVLGFRDGKLRDSFVGVLSESLIRAFVDALLPTPSEQLTTQAHALESADPAAAVAKYREAISLAGPLEAPPRIGLARVLFALGQAEEARRIIDDLAARGYLEPEAETLKAQMLLGQAAEHAAPIDDLRARAAANPKDFATRLELAEALAAAGQHPEALELALNLVERDRKGTGEAARQLMLAIFNLLPPESELAADFRRKLSVAL